MSDDKDGLREQRSEFYRKDRVPTAKTIQFYPLSVAKVCHFINAGRIKWAAGTNRAK